MNSLPLRQNNISDNDYDVVLINHYSVVLKDHDYLRCTDINEDVRFGQTQHLSLYRKHDDRSWAMTHGCGQCDCRVPVQLERRTQYLHNVFSRSNNIPSQHWNEIDIKTKTSWQMICTTEDERINFNRLIRARLSGN